MEIFPSGKIIWGRGLLGAPRKIKFFEVKTQKSNVKNENQKLKILAEVVTRLPINFNFESVKLMVKRHALGQQLDLYIFLTSTKLE